MRITHDADALADAWDDEPTYPMTTRPRARVLVVDDDRRMRGLVCAQLARDGYDVFESSSGDDALDLLGMMQLDQWPADGVDLLVMDIHMPGSSGLDVLRKLRGDRVATPAVIMTGFATEPNLSEILADLGATLLSKPFSLESLSDTAIGSIMAR